MTKVSFSFTGIIYYNSCTDTAVYRHRMCDKNKIRLELFLKAKAIQQSKNCKFLLLLTRYVIKSQLIYFQTIKTVLMS